MRLLFGLFSGGYSIRKNILTERPQDNWVATFNSTNRTHTVLGPTKDILYADWTNADQMTVDLSENRGRYRLEMTILMRSENPDVDPGDILKNFVLKLRSSDVNGQENNYGWTLARSEYDGKESFVISIPLDQVGNQINHEMDWSDVRRFLIVQGLMETNVCTGNRYQYSMTIRSARIVNTAK